MALPTFNGFSLQDSNFIAERITFKGLAKRGVMRAKINRREGIKILNTEFGEKEVTIEGQIIAASATALQTLVDNLKKNLVIEEGALVIEQGRTFTATVTELAVPDEHYNQSKAPFMVTFVCSDPFAVGSNLSVTTPVVSGTTTFSGVVNISGSYFARPTIVYTPPSATGNTLIRSLVLSHTPTGQTVTVTGFNSSSAGGLRYQDPVTFDMDSFTTTEGTTSVNNSGAFPRWEPGTNEFTLTPSGRAFPGGSVTINYQPRYL